MPLAAMFQAYIKSILSILFVSTLFFGGVRAYAIPPTPASPSEFTFQVGVHYQRLPDAMRHNKEILQLIQEDSDRIQVLFFFSYACYWCGQLDHPFDQWGAKQKNPVVLYHIPVIFQPNWEILSRLYYTIQSFKNAAVLDDAIFNGIHQQRRNLTQMPELEKFIGEQGADLKVFKETLNSFQVAHQANRARELSKAYEISQTPHIIVNGPHNSYATSWAMAGSQETLFQILDYLILKEKASTKEKQSSKAKN